MRLSRLLLLSLLLTACGDDDGTIEPDAGTDAGSDAGFDAGSDVGTDTGPDTPVLLVDGASCSAPADCMSGFCVDGVCCGTACDGECERCDGSAPGTCAPVGDGMDPDDECGAITCQTEYIATGDVCSFREDATDSACDGAGACQGTSAACASQPAGVEQISCATCASLEVDTCIGDVPGSCNLAMPFVDDFDGPTLAAGWVVDHVGMAPTFTVGGTLQITDSPPADTPSSSCNWIYDATQDKGNQISRPAAIGSGDFVLEFDFTATSTIPQLTLGGVALTAADDTLQVYGYFGDGSELGVGGTTGSVGSGRWGEAWSGGVTGETVSGSYRIERVAGTITTTYDGAVVDVSTEAIADIANLVIFHTKHVCGPTFEYGTFEVDRISLCF